MAFLSHMDGPTYLSEVFKIVEGASRLDSAKVRNYAGLLADKLAASGEEVSARRLRKLLSAPGPELRPALVSTRSESLPVDAESRFPLLEISESDNSTLKFIGTEEADAVASEFTTAVQHRERLIDRGLSPASSLLIYGPPGCGKSHLAKAISARLGLPLVTARLDGIISSFLGSTAKNLRAIFEYAAKTPCVLFLDEFDAVAKVRDDSQELGELKRVVNSFIQTLDVFRNDIVLIAATNHDQLLDSAIWRRFSFSLRLGAPNLSQRTQLWRLYGGVLEWSDREIDILSDFSEGHSCSSIKEVSDRLLQRWFTLQERRTLRKAIETLGRHRRVEHRDKPIDFKVLEQPKMAYDSLHSRNPRLYTQELVSELCGVSRATLNRK